jgi:hypothetical protein
MLIDFVFCRQHPAQETIPYFSSRKRCKREGKAAESSCQVRILHLVLRSIGCTQLMTVYHCSRKSGAVHRAAHKRRG